MCRTPLLVEVVCAMNHTIFLVNDSVLPIRGTLNVIVLQVGQPTTTIDDLNYYYRIGNNLLFARGIACSTIELKIIIYETCVMLMAPQLPCIVRSNISCHRSPSTKNRSR